MKANYKKVRELSESYLNGNISYVKSKIKTINKIEFVLLCAEIVSLSNNADIDQIAFKLTN